MKLSFDPGARDELDAIYDWIAQDNPDAAFRFIERIEARVRDLAHLPRTPKPTSP